MTTDQKNKRKFSTPTHEIKFRFDIEWNKLNRALNLIKYMINIYYSCYNIRKYRNGQHMRHNKSPKIPLKQKVYAY